MTALPSFIPFRRGHLTVAHLAGLMGLLGLLCTLVASFGLAWLEYDRRFEAAEQATRTEAFFLADHAARLFEVAEVGLNEATALTDGIDWPSIAASQALHTQLRALADSLPYVEDVWLNDEAGILRATSFAIPAPFSNAADREGFKAALAPSAGKTLFIGPLITGRVTHAATFLISRRIEAPDRSFRGMVSVTADLGYFDDYWRTISLPNDARVTLTRAETLGTLAQFPKASAVGDSPLKALAENGSPIGNMGSYDIANGSQRLGSFRRVADLPLYVGVDIKRGAILTAWRNWLWQSAPIAAIGFLAFGLLTGLSWRQARIENESRDALTEANRGLVAEMESRQRAEDQLRQMHKMEAIGQLTGGLAHDFNNMLAIIIGSLGMIKRRLDRGDADIGRFISTAQDGAQRAATLTQRLLAFARRQPLSPETVDANRFIAGLSDLLQRTLTEAVHVETVLAGGLWKTRVDIGQLENAIVNLAVNSRDAMPNGGKLTIETANASLDADYMKEHPGIPQGQYVLVAVTDTGSGMSAETRAKAFDPFFTTKPSGQGTGLGLSQVYGFVRQSGGHVKIYSEAGQGTTVKLYLPRYYGAMQEAPPPSLVPDMPAQGSRQEIVLVVDDEEAIRRLSTDALRDLGYTVLHADGANTALTILRTHAEIQLLFTDVVMPEVNGRQLAEEALKLKPDLRVLFTTGYTRNAVVHNGLLDPGVRLIGKPFSVEQLARSIRDTLDAPQTGL